MDGSGTAGTRPVVVIGLMGAGKTTIGAALAARLGRPFVDNDATLLRRTGPRARDIARTNGLDALHRQELAALAAALADPEPAVIAAAAGAAADPEASSLLTGSVVVYLRAAPQVLESRIRAAAGDGHRPDLDLAAQFAARDGRYRELASVVVDAAAPPESVVAAAVDGVTRALRRR